MRYLYDRNNNLIGKFDEENVIEIGNNYKPNTFKWNILYKTLKGNYIIMAKSLYEGDFDRYSLISREEAMELLKEWGYKEEDIKKYFKRRGIKML